MNNIFKKYLPVFFFSVFCFSIANAATVFCGGWSRCESKPLVARPGIDVISAEIRFPDATWHVIDANDGRVVTSGKGPSCLGSVRKSIVGAKSKKGYYLKMSYNPWHPCSFFPKDPFGHGGAGKLSN